MTNEETASQPRISLALSSGGARGFAHVGVIKALREAGFAIASVTGSSMGGIMAAGYAIRGDVAELEQLVLNFRARDHMRRLLPVMDPGRLIAFLDEILAGATFADCAVPLAIVATDLRQRQPALLNEGPVSLAAFASSALPFLHHPVNWGGRLLADGALSCALPIAQAQSDEADLIIGSLVSRPLAAFNGFVGGMARNVGGLIRGWSQPYAEFFRDYLPHATPAEPAPDETAAAPLLVLNPLLERIGPLDFGRVRDLVAAGEEAVWSRIDEIRALVASAERGTRSAE